MPSRQRLMAVLMLVRSRAAAHSSPIIRSIAERDEQAWDAALSRREANVLRGRWDLRRHTAGLITRRSRVWKSCASCVPPVEHHCRR
jgi:hypothetical protein